jgi:hypothetical protein
MDTVPWRRKYPQYRPQNTPGNGYCALEKKVSSIQTPEYTREWILCLGEESILNTDP